MLKNKIYKYITIEFTKSFLTILFALSAIAWTVRAVSFLDLIVENGHSVITYLQFSTLNLTNIITKFIPLSFLLSLVLTIIKFEKQNELIILWTSGVNKIKLVNLFFLISLLVLAFQLLFASIITPSSLNKSRSLIRVSDFNSISTIIKSNDFSDSFKNITFYTEKKNSLNEMENVFIRDENNTFKNIISNQEDSSNTTIIAEKGFISNKKLLLINGIIQTQNKYGKISNINFTKTELSIDALKPRTITKPKLQETTTFALISCFLKDKSTVLLKFLNSCPSKKINKDIISTVLRRIGMPLYIPLVALLCCFLLISTKKRKYRYMQNYIYFFLGFVVLVCAEILVRYSGFSKLNSFLYFTVPLFLMPIVYFILLKKLNREKKI
ncbi:LptF/LptG family permease [Pelagibacteraceae bacterium]|nr:LptF/LptG family permease [Pelagibacteraceae bacterium]